jgi:hypothetical protein
MRLKAAQRGCGPVVLAILALISASMLCACAVDRSKCERAVTDFLDAARRGDVALASSLMPSLRSLPPASQSKALHAFAALGQHRITGMKPKPGGYIISISFPQSDSATIVELPVTITEGSPTIGDTLSFSKRIGTVELDK